MTPPVSRMPALLGLAMALAAAIWWLAQLHAAALRSASPLGASAALLQFLPLLQALGLSLLLPELSARRGPWLALGQGLAWLAPAWPVLLLALATGAPGAMALAGPPILTVVLALAVWPLRHAPLLTLRLTGVACAAACWRFWP